MSLVKFQTALSDAFPALDPAVTTFIQDYIATEQASYTKNKENKALTWGKYAGYTIKELCLTEKGKSYVEWLLSQAFFTEDKFGDLIAECKALGIKKKVQKKAPLN